MSRQRVIGFAGWSGSGKTTLLVKLIPALIARGISVSTLKHAHHAFEVDQKGKDSYAHREAGAREVLISSRSRFALMREYRSEAEPGLGELLSRLQPVDLVLVEGFKQERHHKIEIHRPANGKPFLHPGDPAIKAIASDVVLTGLAIPCLDLNDVAAIAEACLDHAAPFPV